MRATTGHGARARLASVAALALVLMAGLGACGDDGTDGTGGDGEPLKVGMTLELPPQGFLDDQGNPAGFEYNMLVAAADRLGYEIEVVRTPFEQAFVGLSSGRYDVFVGGIYIRCERLDGTEAELAFSVPIYEEDQVITTTSENASVDSLDDIDGGSLAVEAKGSTADAIATGFLEENPDVSFSIDYYDNVTDAVLALEQGRDDAMLQARIVTLDAIQDNPDLQITGAVPDSGFPVGFVFEPGNDLKAEFDSVLNEMKEDGSLAEIWTEWFGSEPPEGSPTTTVIPEVTLDTCKTAG